MKHVVMFSGGVCSWAAAKRVVERHGTRDLILLFADTMMEDQDLYRFLDGASANIGVPVTRIADGRTPWEVMRDEKIIANTRVDICSRILKRELLSKWRDENCNVEDSVIYFGMDWTETARFDRTRKRYLPWNYQAPMTEPPYLSKNKMLDMLRSEGIEPPRLYGMGFPHNNCGGFCVKAGQAHFALLLRTMPERYLEHERKEEEMRELVGDYSIMRDRSGGKTTPLTLRSFREKMEQQLTFDQSDWGGCGCAVD